MNKLLLNHGEEHFGRNDIVIERFKLDGIFLAQSFLNEKAIAGPSGARLDFIGYMYRMSGRLSSLEIMSTLRAIAAMSIEPSPRYNDLLLPPLFM